MAAQSDCQNRPFNYALRRQKTEGDRRQIIAERSWKSVQQQIGEPQVEERAYQI